MVPELPARDRSIKLTNPEQGSLGHWNSRALLDMLGMRGAASPITHLSNNTVPIPMSETSAPKDGPDLSTLLENNRKWAAAEQEKDAGFFSRLANQQKPKYLWIGCSDSRVPANQITGLAPGEVFVHRNVANVVQLNDPNCQSVVQFAIEALEVEHIIVCGHYKCGGVHAAMQGSASGTVAQWISGISSLYADEKEALNQLPEADRFNVLCELNVRHQLANLAQSAPIQHAWAAGRDLSLHGWIYSIEDGLLKDLEVSLHRQEDTGQAP